MKRLPWMVGMLLLCAPLTLAAQTSLQRAYSATADVSMRIYVPTGRIQIVAWDRDSVTVSGTIAANSEFFGGAGAGFAKLGVESIVRNDTVLAQANLVVYVPRRARVWLKMISGTIEADGTKGELELYTVNGSIDVKRAGGVVSIESIDAPVTVANNADDLRIRGGKGPVKLRDISGTASIATVSGSVEIAGGSIPAGRIETIGGAIDVSATAYRGAMLELQTHSGDITISIDAKMSPALDLQTRAAPPSKNWPRGNEKEGRVVARSFKGLIKVRER